MLASIEYFDPINYAQRLRKNGASQELADVIAQETEKTIQAAIAQTRIEIDKKELVTKGDLQLELAKLRHDTLKFIIWTGVVVTLGTMIARGFHWM